MLLQSSERTLILLQSLGVSLPELVPSAVVKAVRVSLVLLPVVNLLYF